MYVILPMYHNINGTKEVLVMPPTVDKAVALSDGRQLDELVSELNNRTRTYNYTPKNNWSALASNTSSIVSNDEIVSLNLSLTGGVITNGTDVATVDFVIKHPLTFLGYCTGETINGTCRFILSPTGTITIYDAPSGTTNIYLNVTVPTSNFAV